MSYATTLLAEEQDALPEVTPVNATITVSAGQNGLSFSSNTPLVVAHGTDVFLQPDKDMTPPVNYNLDFVAGPGISSFQTPAAEIWLDGVKVGYAVNPSSDGSSFTMGFLNNLMKGQQQTSVSFTVFWTSPLLERNKSEDPTILLDPPKS